MLTISQKMHNYEYAPGIATYGGKGLSGDDGLNGNNIFYTNLSFVDDSEFKALARQIINNYMPLKNSTTTLKGRVYQDGDYFFTVDGTIYKLSSLELLRNDRDNIGTYDKYFKIVGRLSIDDASRYVDVIGDDNRLELNNRYTGFDVNVAANGNPNINTAINILSDNIDNDNNINLVQMVAVDNAVNVNSECLVYYNTADDAFHVNTGNAPLIVDGDVKINNDDITNDIDGYSTVMTSNDTLMSWKDISEHMKYDTSNYVDPSTNANRVALKLYVDFTNDKYGAEQKFNIISNELFFKVYLDNVSYCHKLTDMTKTGASPSYLYTTPLNSYIVRDASIMMVSGIYNAEMFLDASR